MSTEGGMKAVVAAKVAIAHSATGVQIANDIHREQSRGTVASTTD